MSLTKTEETLAQQMANGPGTDWALQKLLNLTDFSEFSIGIGLTVVVGGSMISGGLIAPQRFARRLDSAISEGIGKALDGYAEDSPEHKIGSVWRDKIAGAFEADVKERQEEEEKHYKRLEEIVKEKSLGDVGDLKLDDLSDDEALTDIAYSGVRQAFALENAVISGPPSFAGHEIGTVRVQTAQIEAWWTYGIPSSDPSKE